ncbi:MAG TPA: MotA/TolQ/ExbB proton channel family protein [Candidatus Polarisedimenticolia bacterium]|nr:MotA/TolQ/ExbB proton channel family protein [Candidatus Polarisedimenticolia bacterium]
MTDEAVTEVATATGVFSTDIFRLIAESGFVVKGVLFVLLAFSVLSWAVIIERYRWLRRAEKDSDAFMQDLERERRLTELRDRSVRYGDSPLVPIFVAGFRELTAAISEALGGRRGDPGATGDRDRILGRVRRRLEEAGGAEADRLDRNLGILATTGSVTPFIGLFGTVWGIINSFQGIGMTGSASLAAVAPGISEALVATAAGLAAAIPAVIGYNLLLGRARRMGTRIDRFVTAFASMAESQIDSVQAPAAPIEAGKLRL